MAFDTVYVSDSLIRLIGKNWFRMYFLDGFLPELYISAFFGHSTAQRSTAQHSNLRSTAQFIFSAIFYNMIYSLWCLVCLSTQAQTNIFFSAAVSKKFAAQHSTALSQRRAMQHNTVCTALVPTLRSCTLCSIFHLHGQIHDYDSYFWKSWVVFEKS